MWQFARTRRVGAGGVRLPGGDRPELRRHLPAELVPERSADDRPTRRRGRANRGGADRRRPTHDDRGPRYANDHDTGGSLYRVRDRPGAPPGSVGRARRHRRHVDVPRADRFLRAGRSAEAAMDLSNDERGDDDAVADVARRRCRRRGDGRGEAGPRLVHRPSRPRCRRARGAVRRCRLACARHA